MSPRAMLEPLAFAFGFDATSAGGAMRMTMRGGLPVAELAEDDLALPHQGAPARLTRAQETELPREISFGFSDAATDYRRSAATSRRLVGGSNRTLHSDLAVVCDAATMTRRADIGLQDMWAGRETVQFALGRAHLALSPGDVIALTLGERRRLFEIGEIVDADVRQIRARSIDPEIFAAPLPIAPPRAPEIVRPLGPAHAVALDLPALDSSAADVLTRLAVFAQPWPGGVVVWQSADGASYAPHAIAGRPAVIGETLDSLAAGPTALWDRGNSVRVRLYGGALSSASDARVLAGANAAALRTPAGWEIIQFAHAELIDGLTYRLSRLLRGQLGSDVAMAALLAPGATFVLLDSSLVPIAQGLDSLDRPLRLRLAASGVGHDDASAVALTVTPSATALKPLSPVHVRAARSADGVVVTWIRRTRIEGDGWAGETPLGEEREAYRLDILSGGSIVRSLETAAPQALYAAALELADFGAPQAALHVRVAQLSGTVGAGFASDLTLTV